MSKHHHSSDHGSTSGGITPAVRSGAGASEGIATMRRVHRRWTIAAGIVGLAAIPAVVMAASLGTFENRNKVSLPTSLVRKVGTVQCGFVGGHWVPGTVVSGHTSSGHRWFITRAQQATNYRVAARSAHPATRARALLTAAARYHRLAVAGSRPGHACATLRAPVSEPVSSIVPMPSGTMPGWTQVFADDFSQNVPLGSFPAAVAGLWGNSYADGTGTTLVNGAPKGQYWPSKTVSESGGTLNIHVHTENGIPMSAALLPTIAGATGPGGGQTYGRYTFRFKVDAVPGYKVAFLLWPDTTPNGGPGNGEIDFPEFNFNSTIWGHFHRQGSTTWSDYRAVDTNVVAASGWHIATITWRPGALSYALDGHTVLAVTGSAVPDTPMHMVIQSETYTDQAALPSAGASGDLRLDWLVISKPS